MSRSVPSRAFQIHHSFIHTNIRRHIRRFCKPSKTAEEVFTYATCWRWTTRSCFVRSRTSYAFFTVLQLRAGRTCKGVMFSFRQFSQTDSGDSSFLYSRHGEFWVWRWPLITAQYEGLGAWIFTTTPLLAFTLQSLSTVKQGWHVGTGEPSTFLSWHNSIQTAHFIILFSVKWT